MGPDTRKPGQREFPGEAPRRLGATAPEATPEGIVLRPVESGMGEYMTVAQPVKAWRRCGDSNACGGKQWREPALMPALGQLRFVQYDKQRYRPGGKLWQGRLSSCLTEEGSGSGRGENRGQTTFLRSESRGKSGQALFSWG